MDTKKFADIAKLAAEVPSESLPQDQETRAELLTALRKLTASLEDPVHWILKFLFQPHQNSVIRIAIALDLFALVKGKEEDGTSAEQIESLTGAELALIGLYSFLSTLKHPETNSSAESHHEVRLMRVLTAMGIFSEVGEQRYAATPISRAWTSPSLRDATKHLFDEAAFSLSTMPTFLQQTKYRNPLDSVHGPFQFAFKTNLGMFEFLNERPKRLSAFNTAMEGHRADRIPWFQYYPVDSSLGDGMQNEKAVLIVDVGGGRGHGLEAFKSAFPNQRGRLVLQDLPETIDDIDHLALGVESVKHDFFTTQPIQGASAYYFRSIFHDWSDDKCGIILKHTAEAMRSGHSRVLINEWVLPNQGSPLYPATMDINMMALSLGMERTEKHWNALLSSVGLKIVKIWGIGPEMESLIEAVLE